MKVLDPLEKPERVELGDWLERLRLRSQLELFEKAGYDDLEWMLLQMNSSIPLTD